MLWRKKNLQYTLMEQFYPRQFYWERGKGATLPLPGLKLGSLRSPRFLALADFFFAAYFPHCGAWSQAKRPRTQTEYRKSKGGKDRPNWEKWTDGTLKSVRNNGPAFFIFFLVGSVEHEFLACSSY